MKSLKFLAASTALLVANTAFSLTHVLEIEGQVDDLIGPPSLAGQLQALQVYSGGLKFKGQVVIRDLNEYFYRDSNKVFQTKSASINLSNNSKVGFTIMGNDLGGFEGKRLFAVNPDFDPSKPECSSKNFNNGNCAELNPKTLRFTKPQTANYGQLLGDANLEIKDGKIGKFTWSMDRSQRLDSYDALIANNGLNFVMKQVNFYMGTDGYTFDRQVGDIIFYKPKSMHMSVEVQEVPVPAAAWLFGSAVLGLAGLKKRK